MEGFYLPIFGMLYSICDNNRSQSIHFSPGHRSAIVNNYPIMGNSLNRVQVFFFSAGPAKSIMMCLSAVPFLLQPLPAHALLPAGELPAQVRGMGETQSKLDQSQATFTL